MTKNHCINCNTELKKVTQPAYTKYKCSECGYHVPNKTRLCEKHPNADAYEIKVKENSSFRKCRNCGTLPKRKTKNGKQLKAKDSLQHQVKFDRKFMRVLEKSQKNRDPKKVLMALVKHINKYSSKKAITDFKETILPNELLSGIIDSTDCDKWVEKSKLENMVLWTLTLFLNGKLASLPIKAIADASSTPLARKLTDEKPVDHNTLGVRLEKPNLVSGLETVFQLCSAQLGTQVFNNGQNLIPVYYDWFYFKKSGNIWVPCKEIGSGDNTKGIKIGIGTDWESNAIVSLIMHGEEHPNDAKSFRRDLMISERPGLIHISDKGPSSSYTMQKILENKQHFIIPLKKNIKYNVLYQINVGVQELTLRTPSAPKIRILEESIIQLTNNLISRDLKYIKFQYNSSETGEFKTMELLSSLPMDAAKIIEMSAWRWRSTETEFRIYQHEFGLEKIYLKKPEKVWPLLLLVLICKMLLEFIFRCIHMLHGGRMMMSPFKRGLAKFLNAVISGEEAWSLIEPCNSPVCPYRRKHGQRLR